MCLQIYQIPTDYAKNLYKNVRYNCFKGTYHYIHGTEGICGDLHNNKD